MWQNENWKNHSGTASPSLISSAHFYITQGLSLGLSPIWISFGLFVNEDVFGGFYLFNSVNSAHSTNVNSAQPDVLILYFSLELIFNQKRRHQGVWLLQATL